MNKGTSSNLVDEKRELNKQLKCYLDILNHEKIRYGWAAIIIISIILDMVPFEYVVPSMGESLLRNVGNMIAITVVIWTAMVTWGIFALQKLDGIYYGIRINDFLIQELGANKVKKLFVCILGELGLLIVITILEFEITIAVNLMLQFYTMVCLLLMILLRISRTYVKERIFDESIKIICNSSEDVENPVLLLRMIECIDYGSINEREELIEVLTTVMPKRTSSKAKEGNEIMINKSINCVSKKITQHILQKKEHNEEVFDVIVHWFMAGDTTLETKQGIIMALLEDNLPVGYQFLHELLSKEDSYYNEIWIWAGVYSFYLQECGQEWRKKYTDSFLRRINFPSKVQNQYMAMKYLAQIDVTAQDNWKWRNRFLAFGKG